MAVSLDRQLARRAIRLLAEGLLMYCAFNPVDSLLAADPYAAIYRRNVFHLRPRPIANVQVAHHPLPKIRLTGIITILKGKRALLKVEFPGKPANRAESFILTEGQKAGALEVLKINEKAAQVKVDYSGTITNLTFEKLPPTVPGPVKPVNRWRGVTYRAAYR